ncbi:beta-mannosidase [Luteibacter sp. UNC138MFCol5.1]|uniref:beta-mannosidase n=1 Tax=Luteibacter sp. UNC138MFCol5.1 TaxID=1502774 RepID=UPI0008D497AF|nr:glycoside hydrolase family 2 protein [Luteibacter sp. UNC138MFCol5.1]SEP12292.1 beta-mannosidase [Luteibacter sp. UNC138MFCol5.1]
MRRASLALVAWLLAGVAGAATPVEKDLSAGWRFRLASGGAADSFRGASGGLTKPVACDARCKPFRDWRPAHVPGAVQTDLLELGRIADPFWRDNEAGLQWIGLSDWDYQLDFDVDAATLARGHVDLVFDGLDTYAEVSLNGKKLLSADNMFRQWRLPVKNTLRASRNTLTVHLQSPIARLQPWLMKQPYSLPGEFDSAFGDEPKGKQTSNYVRKANYQYGWDWGPRYVTLGIWRPVRLESWDDLRLADLHIAQRHVDADTAKLAAQFDVRADKAGKVTLDVAWTAPDGKTGSEKRDVALKAGENHVEVPIAIDHPQRWWPVGYGKPDLYRFHGSVSAGGTSLAEADRETGLRSVELRREKDQWGRGFAFVVNGVPIFAKGANLIPYDAFPSRVSTERLEAILRSAKDANMNMLRMWGGGTYQDDAFYAAADRMGMMIWQDFMFGGAITPYDDAFRETTRIEATEQVTRLRDHPSIVLWAGNNEVQTGWESWPDREDFRKFVNADEVRRIEDGMRVLFGDTLRKVVTSLSPEVPYWASSPGTDFEREANVLDDGDYHYWKVWSGSEPISHYLDVTPRFQSEYGLQSFPVMATIKAFAKAEDMEPESKVMRAHQKFANGDGNQRLLLYIRQEYGEPKDFASFVYLSQVMQAEGIELAAEHLRSARPRNMGSLYWQLNDVWPGASWASVDYFNRWKALQFHAKRFYAPVDVVPMRRDGRTEVFAVSDRTTDFDATLRTRVYDMGGKLLRETSQPVRAAALASTKAVTVDDATLLKGADPRRTVVSFDLLEAGKPAAHHLLYFGAARTLALPRPELSTKLRSEGGRTLLTVTAKRLARAVWIDTGDLDVRLDENAFDLLPGESVDIVVKGDVDIDTLRRTLSVRSLVDALKEATP